MPDFPSELVEAAAKALRDDPVYDFKAGEWRSDPVQFLAKIVPLIQQAERDRNAAAMNSLAAEIHRERNRALTAAVDALRNHDDGIAHEPGYTTGWDEAADFIAAMRLKEAAHARR